MGVAGGDDAVARGRAEAGGRDVMSEVLPPPKPPDSLIYKLRFTPLRDVFRGRLTGRMDLGRVIAESGLPPALREIVGATARRTRLRWREQEDVARELIAHFRDGL